MEQNYTLVVRKKRIPVTGKVYKAYYQCRDREKYLDKLAAKNNISLDGCIEKGISVEYVISSASTMEDEIILKEMILKMRDCILQLEESERELIKNIYFTGKSEYKLSSEMGIPRMTIRSRKEKILQKLKKLMEK